jgi:hypothetical protein
MAYIMRNGDGSVHSTYGELGESERSFVEASVKDGALFKASHAEMLEAAREQRKVSAVRTVPSEPKFAAETLVIDDVVDEVVDEPAEDAEEVKTNNGKSRKAV